MDDYKEGCRHMHVIKKVVYGFSEITNIGKTTVTGCILPVLKVIAVLLS